MQKYDYLFISLYIFCPGWLRPELLKTTLTVMTLVKYRTATTGPQFPNVSLSHSSIEPMPPAPGVPIDYPCPVLLFSLLLCSDTRYYVILSLSGKMRKRRR